MNMFLRKLSLISILLIVLLTIMGMARKALIQRHSWKLPESVHILFLGASHINHAIDDSMMKSAINWTRGSERYMYTYIKLQHLLPENPQVDTVFLELAPTDLWEDTDYKYHMLNEQAGYVRIYWPFYKLEHWKVVLEEPVQVAGFVINTLFTSNGLEREAWWNEMGGYYNVTDTMDATKVTRKLVKHDGFGHQVNYYYLRQIITICHQRNIKLFFLETPTYHPEYFYDQEYFYKAYQKNFSDVEFLDYSKWPMADDERYDAHHLNHKGAVRFTKEIQTRFEIR